MAVDVRYVVDLWEHLVSETRKLYDPDGLAEPYFAYGHPLDVANKLALMEQDSTYKSQKFPMVLLILDTELRKGESIQYEYSHSPQILILANTEPAYISEERTTNVFKPILYPIYRNLITAMTKCPYIAYNPNGIDHTHTDRYFWGKEGIRMRGNDSLIFNEYLDGIELNFNNIEVYKYNNC